MNYAKKVIQREIESGNKRIYLPTDIKYIEKGLPVQSDYTKKILSDELDRQNKLHDFIVNYSGLDEWTVEDLHNKNIDADEVSGNINDLLKALGFKK